jgi:hypothetical protein
MLSIKRFSQRYIYPGTWLVLVILLGFELRTLHQSLKERLAARLDSRAGSGERRLISE